LWHYVDLPVGFATYSLTGPFSGANDIVHAIRRAIDVLEGKSSEFTKAQALRILVHLVGDIHQPRHTVSGYYNLADLGRPQRISHPDLAFGQPMDRGGNQLFYTKTQELHKVWDKILVVKVAKSPEQLADLLREEPLIPPTLGDYHAWPMKWVEDSEKVAISVYAGLQFGAAKLKHDGSFDRIKITFSGGSRAYFQAEVVPVQIQVKKAAVHLAQLLNAIQYEP
jgi:hypothetical protein